MKKGVFFSFLFLALLISFPLISHAQLKPGEPIVFGVPTALGAIEGRDGLLAINMARDEINAKGGVLVGTTKHKIEVYSIDTREHEPGIPVQDALTAMEKLILEKKPHAIVLGNFRSEVLLSSMDLISKYKLPYICSIAMTPITCSCGYTHGLTIETPRRGVSIAALLHSHVPASCLYYS